MREQLEQRDVAERVGRPDGLLRQDGANRRIPRETATAGGDDTCDPRRGHGLRIGPEMPEIVRRRLDVSAGLAYSGDRERRQTLAGHDCAAERRELVARANRFE